MNKTSKLKIVTVDIETTPAQVYTWSLYPTAISHQSIIEDFSIICAAYKYLDKPNVQGFKVDVVGDDFEVVRKLSEVLTDVDVVVGQNLDRFDIKKLQARLVYHGLPPLPKLVTVDTLKVAKKVGGFTSNRLDYLGKHLLGEGKMHVDYDLWLQVMKGSKEAINKMFAYNKMDVVRGEALYLKLRPYMHNHPHVAVMQDGVKCDCPTCGSSNLQKRGFRVTAGGNKYQRLQCECGSWHSVPLKAIKTV